jgi:hypothetical protein
MNTLTHPDSEKEYGSGPFSLREYGLGGPPTNNLNAPQLIDLGWLALHSGGEQAAYRAGKALVLVTFCNCRLRSALFFRSCLGSMLRSCLSYLLAIFVAVNRSRWICGIGVKPMRNLKLPCTNLEDGH